MSKILIAYFSRRGENYVNGIVKNLEQGNNEFAAGLMQDLLGNNRATLFQIDSAEEYPTDYYKTIEKAKQELHDNVRPALKHTLDSIGEYDTILLLYPNWWGQLPMPVFTFLEQFNWEGKTIFPFCTHEGSGLSVTVRSIERVCKGANIGKSLSIQGGSIHQSKEKIASWLQENGLI